MTLETELWSLDPGEGRSIRVTLKPRNMPRFAEFDFRWEDGEPVTFPIKLTFVDRQNLADLLDQARNHGIRVKKPWGLRL